MKRIIFVAFFAILLTFVNQVFAQSNQDNIKIYFENTDVVFFEFGDYVKVEFLIEGLYNSSKPYIEKAQTIDEIKRISIKNMPDQNGRNSASVLLNKDNYQLAFTKLINTVFKQQDVKVGENHESVDISTFLNNNQVKK